MFMKGKDSFTKKEIIALEMLLQQYAKASHRKQKVLVEQMKLFDFHISRFTKNNILSIEEFRKKVKTIEEPITVNLPKASTAVSISAILKEFMQEYNNHSSSQDIFLDFKSDILLQLGKIGFEGFIAIDCIAKHASSIPNNKGVYMILQLHPQLPDFSKLNELNFTTRTCLDKWVEDAKVLYIGTSTKYNSMHNLQDSLSNMVKSKGVKIGDMGGALINSMPKPEELLVCWKVVAGGDPKLLQKNSF